MRIIRLLKWCTAVVILPVILPPDTSAVDSTIVLQLTPDRIEVGVFYNGASVQVTAETPVCDGVVLTLRSENEEVKLNRKGRVAGIWFNVADVTIGGIPRIYMLATSKQLDDICSEEVQERLGLGLRSLRNRMKITSEKSLKGIEAEEYLKLKLQSGAYDTGLTITSTPISESRWKLEALLPVSASVPPGTYHVTLYCFKQGQLILQKTTALDLRRVGMVKLLANMAHERAGLYGIVAIVIAMMVGFSIGMIFQSLPGSGH
jgi:uncharacterized protein (TIGR02186 family)